MSQSKSIDIKATLKKLFEDAESSGSTEYIFTLIRVGGITCDTKDPILELKCKLDIFNICSADINVFKEIFTYQRIEEVFSVLANLCYCSVSGAYNYMPFFHLYEGKYPNLKTPILYKLVQELIKIAKETNNSQLVNIISNAFSSPFLSSFDGQKEENHTELSIEDLKSLKIFIKAFIEIYYDTLKQFCDRPIFYKLPRFEVLELLVCEDIGLHGFKCHFSNGNSAYFIRKEDSTETVNIYLEVPIGFDVGFLNNLCHEWRVGKKRLYEIGLPGHYNKLGEWKPIIYPGNSDSLQRDAQKISDDPEVQGILFYMMCTGHRVFEFVMKATLDIPLEYFTIGKYIHFWKCPPKDGFNPNNTVIYDGWAELEHIEPEYIRAVIDQIGIVINRLAFAYDADVTWCPKYRMTRSIGSCASPKEEDLGIINSLLEEFPQTEDANILLSAIDWYNKGRSSSNIFTSFLCYYIAMESVANAIVEGDAHLGIDFYKDAPKKRKENRIKCIQAKHSELYQDNPTEFVTQSYFECVVGLKKRTQQVIEKVFGKDHKYTKLLFEKSEPDCKPLSDIRSEIAHGKINFHSKEDRILVQANLHKVNFICKNFLTRLIFSLKPEESVPAWSGLHSSSMPTNDPRAVLIISNEKNIPNPDWKIKAEWCEN